MASSWGIASFSDVSSDMEVELSFCPSYHGTYSWETNVSATVRTSPELQSISALNRMNIGAPSIGAQPAVDSLRDQMMASVSHTNVDASRGTFNEVSGNQINITNIYPPASIRDECQYECACL